MSFTEGICLPIQQALTETAGSNTPMLKRDRLGYLEALVSRNNLGTVRQVAVPSDGKRKNVEIIYLPRGLESSVQTTQPTAFCDASDTVDLKSQTVQVQRWRHRKLRLSEDDLRKICFDSDAGFGAQVMLAEMNALLLSVNKDLLAIQATKFGEFADDSTVKNISLLDTDNKPDYFAESQLLEEYARISGSGMPMLVGAGDLAHYTRMSNKGCCNMNGIDFSQAGEFAFFYDRNVDTVLDNSEENYILLAPGAVHFLVWNGNVGQYAFKSERDEAGTIVDPYTGIRFDLDMIFDKCTKRYNITLSLNYDLFHLPADAFSATDELEGVNYTLHFQKG